MAKKNTAHATAQAQEELPQAQEAGGQVQETAPQPQDDKPKAPMALAELRAELSNLSSKYAEKRSELQDKYEDDLAKLNDEEAAEKAELTKQIDALEMREDPEAFKERLTAQIRAQVLAELGNRAPAGKPATSKPRASGGSVSGSLKETAATVYNAGKKIGGWFKSDDVKMALGWGEAEKASLAKALSHLVETGYFDREGERRGTKYQVADKSKHYS
jgi:hypothetical protein